MDRWWVFLAVSGVLILAGAICEFRNIAVTQVTILFTLAGVGLGVVSVYQARDRKVAASAAAPASSSAAPAAGPEPPRGTAAPRPPGVYPAAFFAAALLLVLATVMGLAITNKVVIHPPVSSRTEFTYELLSLLVEIVAPVGYFGFSLVLAGRARGFGIIATVFVYVNFIVNGVALFAYLVDFVPGANVPTPVFAYFEYAAAAGIVASAFLVLAVERTDVYPTWIAVVFGLDAVTEIFYLLNHLKWFALDAVMVGDLLLAVAYVGMGICMLRRTPVRVPVPSHV